MNTHPAEPIWISAESIWILHGQSALIGRRGIWVTQKPIKGGHEYQSHSGIIVASWEIARDGRRMLALIPDGQMQQVLKPVEQVEVVIGQPAPNGCEINDDDKTGEATNESAMANGPVCAHPVPTYRQQSLFDLGE